VRCWLGLAEYQDAGSQAGAVEKIRSESDDNLKDIHFKKLAPDLAFFGHTKQNAMREDHCHPARFGSHRLDHVLHPGKISGLGWRQTGKIAAVWVIEPDVVTPLF
jgi:hypothetical protein